MAYIGLKTNHGGMGTDLAATLAKAFGSNVTDAVSIARLKNDILTGEANRRQIAADTAWRLGEEQRAAEDQAAARGMTPAIERIIVANEGPERRPVVVAEPAVAPAAAAPAAAAAAPAAAPAAAVVAEPPVVVEPAVAAAPAAAAPAAAAPPPPVPASFPGRPALIAPNGRPVPPALEQIMTPPTITGRPDAPALAVQEQLPVSSFPARPAGPQLAYDTDDNMQPEVPVIDTLARGRESAGTGNFLTDLLRPIGSLGQAPSDFPARPAGPQLPAEALPETPLPVEPLVEPLPLKSTGRPGDPTALSPLAPPTGPIAARPDAMPLTSRPEEPLPIEPLPSEVAGTPAAPAAPPVEQPTAAAAAGAGGAEAAAPPPPAAGASPAPAVEQATATAAANPKPEGSVGTGKVTGDGGSVYQTDEGPIRLTKEETHALALGIALGDDPGGQLTKLSAIIKTTFDPRVTLTDNQKAILLSGHVPPGTPEAIAAEKETAAADPSKGIVEVDKRKYQVRVDAQGNKSLELIPGQPETGAPNAFGTGDAASQLNYMSNLVTTKPDPKTWTPQERQNYAIMASVNFKADVKVTDSGKIVYVGAEMPPGLLPPGSTKGDAEAPTETQAAQPPLAGVPPDLVAPAGTEPAAPAAPAAAPGPASPDAAVAGTAKQNAAGRWVTTRGGVEVPGYGGYQVEGQPPPEPITRTVNGQTITELPPVQGPVEMDAAVGKEFGFTKNAVTPAKYLLNIKPSDVPPMTEQILNDVFAGGSFNAALQTYAMSDKQREYFRNIRAFINAASHRASGADVTKNDLATYSYLFSLPGGDKVTDLDLKNFKTAVRDEIKNSRLGYNGRVPSDQLQEFDFELAKNGIDLDYVEPDVQPRGPRERVMKDGKLVDKT